MKTITGIKARKGRLDVFLNGEFAFSLSRSIASQARLAPEQSLSEAKATALQEADLLQQSLDAAIRFLAFRPRSENEIRTKLRRRHIPEDVIEKALSALKLQGLVNDAVFAAQWKDNRQAFSPRSSRLIATELRRKGISPEVASTATSDLDDDSAACQAARKKAASMAGLERQEFRRKLGGFLTRRGFNYETSNRVVEQLWQELRQS